MNEISFADVLKWGLEVSPRSPNTSAVVSARSSFCIMLYWTALHTPSRKRARIENLKYYEVSFGRKNMKKHAEENHPERFAEYSALISEGKKSYFKYIAKWKNSLQTHNNGENALRFIINNDTIDVITGDMLFNSDDVTTEPTRKRAPGLSKLFRDAERADGEGKNVSIESYEVRLLSSRCFELVL